jgi:hypothetical protein
MLGREDARCADVTPWPGWVRLAEFLRVLGREDARCADVTLP